MKFLVIIFIAMVLAWTYLRSSSQINLTIEAFIGPSYDNCTNVFRTNSLHIKQTAFWQNLTSINTNAKIYIHKFYLDNRNLKNIEVRSFILSEGPLEARSNHSKDMPPIYCSLWFASLTNPISVKGRIMNVQVSDYKIEHVSLITYLVVCPLKIPHGTSATPSHVSLEFSPCKQPETYTVVTIPEESSKSENNDKICVCMTAQYGTVTEEDAPFFIQWIELLLKFGVSKVMIYKGTMKIKGKSYQKALNYYIDSGVLVFEQFPVPFTYKQSHFRAEYSAVESIRSLAVNDCFYREMNKHWFILHIDKDELVVPRKFMTYQEFISDFVKSQEYIKEHKKKKILSLSVRSAFYYRNTTKLNSNVPSYLPMLRYTYRQPTEPTKKSVAGYAKSFVNTRYCNHLWSHRCLKGGDYRFLFLPEDSIIVHHYRDSCPIYDIKSVREPKDGFCDTEEQRQYKDDFIGEHYREFLINRTKPVLQAIGYKYNHN